MKNNSRNILDKKKKQVSTVKGALSVMYMYLKIQVLIGQYFTDIPPTNVKIVISYCTRDN